MDKRGHQNNRASRFLSKDEHNNSGHKNQRHQQGGDGVPAGTMTVTVEEFMRFRGHLLTIVKISNGTSFIQAALKRSPQETLHIVKAELLPHAKSLLLDDNAAYTVRLVMDLDPTAALSFFEETASDEEYWVHLCCDSLHTRRLVLYFLASFPDKLQFLFEIAIRHLTTLACNKNGCLTLQKIMSTMPTEMAARAAAECVSQVPQICLDPHGHYLITYLCENGDIEVNIEGICKVISQPATFLSLARNQYGSSTLEKAVRAFPVKFGAALVTGAMGLSDWELIQVANDSFGNYVVQAAVGVPSLDISADLIKRLGTLSGSLTFATKIFRNVTHSTHRGADAAAPPRRQQSGSTRNDSDCLSKSISPTKCVSSETPTERKSPEPTLVFRTDSPPVELMALEKSVSPSVFTSNSMMGLTNSMGVISPPPQANTAALPPQQQQLPVPPQPMMFQHPQHLLAPHQYANAPMPPMMMHPSNPSMYPPMQLAPQFAPAGPNGMMPFMMPSPPQLQGPMNHQAPPPGMMMVMTPQGPIMVMPVPPQHQQGFA